MRRMLISDESVNGRGFRVLTGGIMLERYEKNPVLLWMHRRGEVVGSVKGLRVFNGELSGEPIFDEASELSRRLKLQYEAGSVRACSMGIDVLEVEGPDEESDEEVVPVVTRCSLYEVSLVDIPENENCVTLRWQGSPIGSERLVELSKQSCGVVLEERVNKNTNQKPKEKKEMELSEMAVLLGLESGASEEAVRTRAGELLSGEAEHVRDELSKVERLVDRAVSEMRITAERKEYYVTLGKQIGSSALEELFGDLCPVGKISETLGHVEPGVAAGAWKKLSDVPESELVELRKSDPRKYATLYKAEYGIEPHFAEVD